jgi:hypothetical protein
VVGLNDTIVTPERSQTLIRVCDDARVEKHDGSEYLAPHTHPSDGSLTRLRLQSPISGHFVPSKANWKNFFVAYLTSFVEGGMEGDVPGPSSQPGGASTTASANTTRPGTPDVAESDSKSAL